MSDEDRQVGVAAGEPVKGEGIKVVRLGSEDQTLPQDVFGVDAVTQKIVGSQGIFISQHRVPPGAHSSPHIHTNCESVVCVLRGRGERSE